MIQATPERKKSFSSFSYKEAVKQLNVLQLHPWALNAKPIQISDFFGSD